MANLRGKYLKCGMYLHQQMLFFAENYIFKCWTSLDVDTNQLTLSHRNLVCSRYPICGCMLLFGGAMRGMSGVPFFVFPKDPYQFLILWQTHTYVKRHCVPLINLCVTCFSKYYTGGNLPVYHSLKQNLWLADTVVCQYAVDTVQQGGWHLSLSLTTGLTLFGVYWMTFMYRYI